MKKKPIKILLLVEDNPADAGLVREMFSKEGLENTELMHVQSLKEAEKHLEGGGVDIVVLDLGLPDAQGLQAVQRAHAVAPHDEIDSSRGWLAVALAAGVAAALALLLHFAPSAEADPGEF